MAKQFLYRWSCLMAVGLCCGCLATEFAFTADDDQIVVLNATPETNEQESLEANFDRWVFPGAQTAAAGKKRMEAQAKLQIGQIERSCRLSAEQKSRLELAARGDFERFIEQAETLRRKYAGVNVNNNDERMQQFWQELRPLQTRQSRGIAGPDTLLSKAITRTLNEDQTKEFDAGQSERRRFRYEASVAVSLHVLELSAPMSSEQRDKLTQALLALAPPKIFGPLDHYVVNYRLSVLSAQPPVKGMLEPRQWQALAPQLTQAKSLRQHLMDMGYHAEDLDVKPAEAKP